MEFNKFVKDAGIFIGGIVNKGDLLLSPLFTSERPLIPEGSSALEFTYAGTDDKGDYNAHVFYTDKYFDRPGTVFNHSLATASLAFAMACGNSTEGYENGYRNIVKLLTDAGFSNVEHNDAFGKMSSLNTIGVAAGTRVVGDSTLVCISVRGIGYGSEWGANLLLGKGIFHQGFDEASDRVLDYLRGYLARCGISGKIKIWIHGYSRSAGTSNLVAGKIDNAIAEGQVSDYLSSEVELGRDDVYAYCFEPPCTVLKDAFDIHGSQFSNIWNIVNPNDVVPILVTSAFGMERFGTDVKLPVQDDPPYLRVRSSMLRFYNSLPNREQIGVYRSDYFHVVEYNPDISWKEIDSKTQPAFIKEFNTVLAEFIGSREFYADNVQVALSQAVCEIKSYAGTARIREALLKAMGDNIVTTVGLLRALHKGEDEEAIDFMRPIVSRATKEMDLDDSKVEGITTGLVKCFKIFRGFLSNNVYLVLCYAVNSKSIFFAHYPELIFAWMMSMDPNYNCS